MFGFDSIQAEDEREKLLRMDDLDLKSRANKFREFLDNNNEKATKAFCRLGKEGGVCDDITQIIKDDGEEFEGENERGEHIRGYYERLYKRRLDNLLGIENFLTENVVSSEWVRNRKLTELEKNSLENEITMEELEKSLEDSNFHSTSGWDGISFKVIRKYWTVLKDVMLKMARETFVRGELIESFKLGLIKLIPKKGDARKVSEWRPITLLCCGYKIISGIVSNRLEKIFDEDNRESSKRLPKAEEHSLVHIKYIR
jgi:hypothetical protein